jgi:hypothetical protein
LEAIEHYKAALSINPGHVDAIAALGRLRYAPPYTPLLDEAKRRAPVDVCEIIIAVRNPCNYRCFYCVGAGTNNEPVKRFNFAELERQYELVNRSLVITSLECGGGEPTVHPEFPKLLNLSARYGVVSFPTNNSQDPRRWLPRSLESRLEIRGALHPEGDPKLDRYLDYANFLIDAGCGFSCVFIAHPTRIAQVPQYSEMFRKRSIRFFAIPFIGTYEGKPYPYSYTEYEKEVLEQYSGTANVSHMMIRINSHVNRIRNFRGIPCLAGHRLLYFREDGRMQRCPYDGRPLKEPLAEAMPCRVKSCGCGMYLEKLNFTQTADMHNYFAQRAGLELIDLGWRTGAAADLGYEDLGAALAAEYMSVYDALMAAYGKDEFPEQVNSGQ